jgi:hypothetical protein
VRLDSAILINPNESWGLNIMSVLGNPRYERAAQVLASGGSAETAAAAAGYNTKGTSFKPNARRLIQRPDIRARVAELQGQIAAAMVIDAAWIRTRVARIADVKIAPDDVRASDVIAAAHLLAKMTKDALVPQTVGIGGAGGEGPAKLELSWLSNGSSSTTLPDYSSGLSTIERSDMPASSPIEEPAKPSPASMTSSEPHFEVDWSDQGSPTSALSEDNPSK